MISLIITGDCIVLCFKIHNARCVVFFLFFVRHAGIFSTVYLMLLFNLEKKKNVGSGF